MIAVAAVVSVAALSQPVQADAISELAAVSVFEKVDPAQGLKPVAARGPKLSDPRDITVQAWCTVPVPLAQAVADFQRWDAQPHPDLGNYSCSTIPASAAPSDFSGLAAAPSNSYVKAFDAATAKLPGGDGTLQLASGDTAKYAAAAGSKGGAISAKSVAFWAEILSGRVRAFSSGGISSQPSYVEGSQTVRPVAEITRLLGEQPAVHQQFAGLMDGSAQLTWNLFKTERQAALTLAAGWSKMEGDGWRHLSVNFYSSGGFYALIEFTQFWPVTVNGREMTLIWRGEAVSSGEVESLRGVERMGASATTMKEARRSLESFAQSVK
ncbi:MAG: hypothetical protein QM796_15990 [Chthoniobacteraceae bacterium]